MATRIVGADQAWDALVACLRKNGHEGLIIPEHTMMGPITELAGSYFQVELREPKGLYRMYLTGKITVTHTLHEPDEEEVP